MAAILRLWTVIFILGFVSQTPARDQSDKQRARDFYYQGVYGDRAAEAEADRQFSELYEKSPADVKVMAYYGSLRLLEAQHSWAPWKKNALSKQGIALLDRAVAHAPDDLEVRFVRAATERNLPPFFGREKQAASDLEFITTRAERAVRQGELEARLAAASFYYWGEWCKQKQADQEARRAWQTAIRIAPESNGGRKSAAALKAAS